MIKSYKTINEEYVELYITNRNGTQHIALIDIGDLDKIINHKYSWYADYCEDINGFYMKSTIYNGLINGKPSNKTIYMHRFLLGEDSAIVDHVNHNGLDNRRLNLRNTTIKRNTKHRSGVNSNNTSGYRNVSFDKSTNQWIVQLQINQKNKVLGRFNDVDEAGKFAETMREKYYGNFCGKYIT